MRVEKTNDVIIITELSLDLMTHLWKFFQINNGTPINRIELFETEMNIIYDDGVGNEQYESISNCEYGYAKIRKLIIYK